MRGIGGLVAVAISAGCSLLVGSTDPEPAQDANDAECDTPIASMLLTDVDVPEPAGDLLLDRPGVYVLNTMLGTLLRPDGTNEAIRQLPAPSLGALVVVARRVSVAEDAVLRLTGTNAGVLLVATSALHVDGVIDASSDDDEIGAGAGLRCGELGAGLAGQPGTGTAGGSGGGGGVLLGQSGQGGAGDGETPGGSGGTVTVPGTEFAGGCAGGKGGLTAGGEGGRGGGAVALIAGCELRITGRVRAHGQGGKGASPGDAGGGGGGSGGLVWIETSLLALGANAVLGATGGGGGGGSDAQVAGASGEDGGDDRTPPLGGVGGGSGGSGGDGGLDLDVFGQVGINSTNGGGGGGGGGSCGRLYLLRESEEFTSGFTTVPSPLPVN